MNHYLNHYDVTLIAAGPVFVGSGRSFSKKEYIIKKPGNNIGIVNAEKLYSYLKGKNLINDFEDFMLNNSLNKSYKDLGGWLSYHRIMVGDIRDCMQYELSGQDTFYETCKRLEIKEFIKDSYGKPYIPGSSLKGMFRTILLSDEIMRNPHEYAGIKTGLIREADNRDTRVNRKAFSDAIMDIETTAFNTLQRNEKRKSDAVNDCMSGFIVSDSDPLDLKDLTLSQKIERHPDGTDKALNILRESIRPGTEIHFSITVDSTICRFDKDRVMSAVGNFSRMYNECFADSFSGVPELSANEVILGGGSGFVGKSCVYSIFEKDEGIRFMMKMFDKTGVSRDHKHSMDLRYGVSPHIYKYTKYNKELLPFGVCKIDMT